MDRDPLDMEMGDDEQADGHEEGAMTTPQNPEHGDKSRKEEPTADISPASAPAPEVPEPLGPSVTEWAMPASNEPLQPSGEDPAAPPPQPVTPPPPAQPAGSDYPSQQQSSENTYSVDAKTPDLPADDRMAPEYDAQEPLGGHESAQHHESQQGAAYLPTSDASQGSPRIGDPGYAPLSDQPYDTPRRPSSTQTVSIIGFVCAGISLLCCPYLFGPAGIILGIIGHYRGESLGKWAAVTSTVTLIIGLIVMFVVFGGDMIPDTN